MNCICNFLDPWEDRELRREIEQDWATEKRRLQQDKMRSDRMMREPMMREPLEQFPMRVPFHPHYPGGPFVLVPDVEELKLDRYWWPEDYNESKEAAERRTVERTMRQIERRKNAGGIWPMK